MKIRREITFVNILHKNLQFDRTDLKGVFSKIYYNDAENWGKNVECKSGDSYVTPYNVFNPAISDVWYTDAGFIQIHIKKKVLIQSYKIKAESTDPSKAHLKNWKFLGSNDEVNWDPLHEETNYAGIQGYGAIKEFLANATKPYSYFKLEKTGPSWDQVTPVRMSIESIDVMKKVCYCKTRQQRQSISICYVLTICLS